AHTAQAYCKIENHCEIAGRAATATFHSARSDERQINVVSRNAVKFSRSRADEHRREFVNVTVPDVGHVKLAGRVLAKRRTIYERDIAARRRNRKKLTGNILKVRSGRSVIIESKYSRASAARSEIITENVNALERGKHRAAINVTADDRASDAVRIIKNG